MPAKARSQSQTAVYQPRKERFRPTRIAAFPHRDRLRDSFLPPFLPQCCSGRAGQLWLAVAQDAPSVESFLQMQFLFSCKCLCSCTGDGRTEPQLTRAVYRFSACFSNQPGRNVLGTKKARRWRASAGAITHCSSVCLSGGGAQGTQSAARWPLQTRTRRTQGEDPATPASLSLHWEMHCISAQPSAASSLM